MTMILFSRSKSTHQYWKKSPELRFQVHDKPCYQMTRDSVGQTDGRWYNEAGGSKILLFCPCAPACNQQDIVDLKKNFTTLLKLKFIIFETF